MHVAGVVVVLWETVTAFGGFPLTLFTSKLLRKYQQVSLRRFMAAVARFMSASICKKGCKKGQLAERLAQES